MAKHIRGLSWGKEAVILAFTGHALRGDREQMLAAGMNDYLSKPFSPTDLKVLIDRYFQAIQNSSEAA